MKSIFSFESIKKNDGLFKDFRLYRQLTIFVPRRITLISNLSYKGNTIKFVESFTQFKDSSELRLGSKL